MFTGPLPGCQRVVVTTGGGNYWPIAGKNRQVGTEIKGLLEEVKWAADTGEIFDQCNMNFEIIRVYLKKKRKIFHVRSAS